MNIEKKVALFGIVVILVILVSQITTTILVSQSIWVVEKLMELNTTFKGFGIWFIKFILHL